MAPGRFTREIGPLALRAAVTPGSFNEEQRTVDVTWTTGARVLRGGFFTDPYYEELDLSPQAVRMDRLRSGAPLLDAHNGAELDAVIGVVESAHLEPGRGVAKVRFARDPRSDAVMAKVKDGILRSVSVGYRVHKMQKVEDGEGKLPVMRAVDWEPYELSMVPMPADAGATVRGERAERAGTNPCEFLAEEKKMDKDESVTTEQTVERQVETDEQRAEAVKLAERSRIATLHRTAATLKLPAAFADEHVNKSTTEAEFQRLAIDEYAKRGRVGLEVGGGAQIEAGRSEAEKFREGVSAWLFQRAGVADVVIDAAKKKGETLKLDPGEFRGLSLVELARNCLERAGVRTRGMDRQHMVGLALTQRASGFNTTSDFPNILENVLYKVLLGAYGITPDTWSMFCMTGSVSDFRANKRYRLGSFAALQTINEHGEFAYQSVPDAYKESISATTKGNMIALSRQAIINDDMSAFSRIATMIGRAARLSVEADVYALLALNSGLGPALTDGDTLFHANHGNITTGAALGVAALDADRVAMKSQKDPSSNEYLDLVPDILVVPAGLGGYARVINAAQYDTDPVTTNATNKFQVPNRVAGLFRAIVDTPRMTGTRRYVFASPQVAPTIEVAFLDGQQEPFMEVQNGWRIDGVEWKVRLDYGVGAIDFRGAVTNAGT